MRTVLGLLLVAGGLFGQTTVTLNGSTYNLGGHPRVFFDGPAGVITTGIKDPDGSGRNLAPKAKTGNAPWDAILSRAPFYYNNYPYKDQNNVAHYKGGQQAAMFAMYWYSDNSQTGYHDAALYMLNHIEQYFPMYCDEAKEDCVAGGGTGYYVGSYGIVFYLPQWLFAYELMRGEMTLQERTDFANKILNDRKEFGGVGGSPTTSCTNPSKNSGVAITVANGTVTSASPLFGTGQTIQTGDWVAMDAGTGYETAHIVSVSDSTHAKVSSDEAGSWNGFVGTISYRRGGWQAGDCGILWLGKHGRFSPQSMSYVGGVTAYPPWGGDQADHSSNNTFAFVPQVIAAFLSVADDDQNASKRSLAELTILYNDWYAKSWNEYVQHGFTGFHFSGSNYGTERPLEIMKIPAMLTWSIDGTPPPVGNGIWAKNTLYHYIMNWLPSCASVEPQYGQIFAINAFGAFPDPSGMSNATMLYALYRNTDEGKWFNWTLRNRIAACYSYGNTPGTNLFWTAAGLAGASSYAISQWEYAHTDPTWPATNISAAGPTAVALNHVDATTNTFPQSVLISRTGYSSITDTLVNFYGMFEKRADHNFPEGGWYPGTYKIFKGNFLLGSDGLNAKYSDVYNNYHAGGAYSNYMELGGATNLLTAADACGATMPRADSDGTSNRFAYAIVDSTSCYVASVKAVKVQRQLMDFKGGGQQFVVVYDDVATSAGKMKRLYLHYPNNLGASADTTRGATVRSGNSITSTNPGTGHSDASQIITQVLSPTGNSVRIYTDNPDGTYTGGLGATFRVSVCASLNATTCDPLNLASEFIVVHQLTAGLNGTASVAEMITTDPNWRGAQVNGSAPKVALFARNGSTFTKLTFKSTHAGTAQIIVAGLKPGAYDISGPTPGSTVVTAGGVLYFEGTSGDYSIGPKAIPKSSVEGRIEAKGKVEIH